MEHVVFFPAPDGTPAFRRLASLDEAVRLVEHLRNVEGVSSASVHALTEVPLAFRAYYRVEVPAQAGAVAEGVVEPAVAAVPEPVFEPGAFPDAAVEVEPPVETPSLAPEAVPALALVEQLSADEPDAERALASSHGHAAPVSLGFFA